MICTFELLTNEHKKRQKEAQVPTEGGRRELNPRAAGQVFTLRPQRGGPLTRDRCRFVEGKSHFCQISHIRC